MKKILVVDDSPSWVKHHIFNIKYILGEENVEIQSAYSAKQGDAALSSNIDKPFIATWVNTMVEHWLKEIQENIAKLTELAEKTESADVTVQEAIESFKQGIVLAQQCLDEINGYKGQLVELKTQMDELNNDR